MFKKILLAIIVFLGLITFAQSETSWIKKKDKSENVEKTEKKKKKKLRKKLNLGLRKNQKINIELI